MTRINVFRNIAGTRDFVAWGKQIHNVSTATWGSIHAIAFSAVLIACSLAVGCSSDKPKPVNAGNQLPITPVQATPTITPASVMQAENKPAPKKVVHRKPATVNYTDKTYGVTFEYPRRYAIETGDAAAELLMSNPVPMNFVQPGGVALAAVELPETGYSNTDFSGAFFNVSVHKNLSADQCNEFAVPQPKNVAMPAPQTTPVETVASSSPATATPAPATETQSAQSSPVTGTAKPAASETQSASSQPAPTQPAAGSSEPAKVEQTGMAKATTDSASEPQGSKLLVGDMELRATEAVSGEGTRQSDSKYFHIYQNGACYEFGLNITTVAQQDGAGLIKHVDRDRVFTRLEKILDTVKISPITAEAAEAPKTPSPVAAETPAQ